jgi:hypothetical protein
MIRNRAGGGNVAGADGVAVHGRDGRGGVRDAGAEILCQHASQRVGEGNLLAPQRGQSGQDACPRLFGVISHPVSPGFFARRG